MIALELPGELALLDPWFLLLVPAALLALAVRSRRARAALPSAATGLLTGLPVTLRQRCRALPAVLQVLGFAALCLALARPVTREVLPVRSEGIDIFLVVDVSSSMNAPDATGDGKPRIVAARERALAFAAARTHDRVGLVTFARFPDLRCPLTLDKEGLAAFLRVLDTVEPRSFEDATAIGAGLAKAVELLRENDAGSRIVVLLSDGENNEFTVSPEDAAKLASDAGVRCYTIGLGQGQVSPFGGVFEPDFTALQEIAQATGGEFWRARTEADLAQVYAEIDRLEKRELEDPRYRTSDVFEAALLAGCVLLVLGLGAQLGFVREVPG